MEPTNWTMLLTAPLSGAIAGAVAGLIGSLISSRAATRRQLLELAVRSGLEDWKVRVEEAREWARDNPGIGIKLPRADDWVVYHVALFEALEPGLTRWRWWRRDDVLERVGKAAAIHDDFHKRFGAGAVPRDSRHSTT